MRTDHNSERSTVTTTPPTLPAPDAVLTGTHIRLEPLTREGIAELAPALRHAEVFAGGFGGGAAAMPDTDDAFVQWYTNYSPSGENARAYLVRDTATGDAIGTTSLYGANFSRFSITIGYTAYTPHVWGTTVNPDAKHTLLEAAFSGGFHRVAFELDARNERSAAAVTKLGAVREAQLREDRLRADGTWRDTLVFSILASEWPQVRERLRARIDVA